MNGIDPSKAALAWPNTVWHSLLCALAGLLCLTLTESAWAQTGTKPTPRNATLQPASMQTCRPLLKRWKTLLALDQQGEKYYKQQKYGDAITYYKKAHKWLQKKAKGGKSLAHRCAAMYFGAYISRLAITYHWHRNFLKAHTLYQRCSKHSPKKLQRKACLAQIKRVQKQLIQLHIEVFPKDAVLLVGRSNNKKKWKSAPQPMKRWFTPGNFVLQMSRRGYTTQREMLVVAPGTRLKRTYRLERSPCPTVPLIRQIGHGQITIITATGALTSSLGQPLKVDRKKLHEDPLGQHPALTPAQIALVVTGITAGAALIGLGAYGIYRLNTRIYSWSPGTP